MYIDIAYLSNKRNLISWFCIKQQAGNRAEFAVVVAETVEADDLRERHAELFKPLRILHGKRRNSIVTKLINT